MQPMDFIAVKCEMIGKHDRVPRNKIIREIFDLRFCTGNEDQDFIRMLEDLLKTAKKKAKK